MDIRLLGSVGFEAEARAVRPASGRARTLLASLAWQPGEFVSDDILAEAGRPRRSRTTGGP